MKYYIIAGEASGDLHGSNLIKEILKKDPSAELRCWGGDLMESAGGEIIKHYKDLAFMGFIEVVSNLRTIVGNMKFCKKDIAAYNPDVVIFIDYPGFNLRIADYVKSIGVKTFYYISPQIWAWDQKRVHKIKKLVDRMFVILPFEEEFYQRFNYKVDYVGHPLLDAIEERDTSEVKLNALRKEFGLTDSPIVLLLPGSRKQEISKMLPLMLKQSIHFPNHQFVLGAAPSFDLEYFDNALKGHPTVKIIANRTYDLLQIAEAALVTSGTATLETALFRVPEVVCYKGSFISYQLAKRFIKVKYISLVNLIMDKEVVRELIQSDFNEKLLKAELGKLLKDSSYRAEMHANFDLLNQTLGGGGASARTAQLMVEALQTA